jgi:hypothetical protein
MTGRWLFGFVAAWVLAAGGAEDLQVATMAREGRVRVSCVLAEGLTSDMEQALQSGLTTVFTYEVDLRRAVSIWFDRTLASSTVTVSAQFDTLTGRYQVTRSVDGRVEESRVSDSQAEAEKFMTAFDRLPLFNTADLEPNVEYLVRVRLRTRPRTTWFLWPFSRGEASGFARFTFIP